MSSTRYAPYYCEENVWFVLAEGTLTDGHAVFITNRSRSVALWSQRASLRDDGLTLWDYHVVALGRAGQQPIVVDLDCTAGSRLALPLWAQATFPFAGAVPEDVEPLFRVVPAADLFAHFRTDRSHMRTPDGGWLAEPPQWPALSGESNLGDYLDPLSDTAPGHVMDLRGLLEFGTGLASPTH